MYQHTPRLRNSLALLMIGTVTIVGGGYLPENWQVFAAFVCGVLMVFLAMAEARWIGAEQFNARIREVAFCPPDRLAVLAYKVPELGFKQTASYPVPMWEGIVELDTFRKFLELSRDDYVAPIREWGKGEEDVYQYNLMLDKLLQLGYVKLDGAPRGPRSWLWRQGALKKLWADWMGWSVVFQGISELT
jgi:hypothetical protein